MKFTMSRKTEDIRDGGGELTFIATEGIFPVTLNFVSIATTKNGAKQVDFNYDFKGESGTIYGPNIQNIDGSQNNIGMSLVFRLGVIADLEDGAAFNIEKETHRVGKDNKEQEFDVFTDFSDLNVWLHVVREYSLYNGEIRSRLNIRNVFREDRASAAEIEAVTAT